MSHVQKICKENNKRRTDRQNNKTFNKRLVKKHEQGGDYGRRRKNYIGKFANVL